MQLAAGLCYPLWRTLPSPLLSSPPPSPQPLLSSPLLRIIRSSSLYFFMHMNRFARSSRDTESSNQGTGSINIASSTSTTLGQSIRYSASLFAQTGNADFVARAYGTANIVAKQSDENPVTKNAVWMACYILWCFAVSVNAVGGFVVELFRY